MGFQRYRLYPRVVNDLIKRSTIGIFLYIVVAGIVLFANDYYLRNFEFSKLFLSLIICTSLFRALTLFAINWTRVKYENIKNYIFILGVLLTALIWGCGFAWFMIQPGESDAKLLMVICTIGLCSGGVVSFIPELRLSLVYSFLMLAPAVATMVFHDENLPLVIAVFIFYIYLCFMANRGNKEYWDALENEYLLEEKTKDLERMSRVDGLTGLYNRRYFDEIFSFEWKRSVRNKTQISIILCDIDHFKQVNDQYGHLAGDDYLRAMAGLLKKVFRRKTDIPARYGGEEFIILMPEESSENACNLAETIRLMIENFRLEYEGQIIQNTMSLGVATYIPHKKDKMEILISKADNALYKSKASGRNKVMRH